MLLLYILICPVSVSWDRACCYCTYLSVLCLYHGTEHVVIVHTYPSCVCIMGQSMLLLYILICPVSVSWDRACCYCTYLSVLCLYHGTEHVVIVHTYLSCVCIMGQSMLLLYILICPVSVSWDRACCYCTYLSVLCLYHGTEHVVIVHTYLPCVCIMGQSMLLLYMYHGTEHVVIVHTYLPCVCIMGQSMLLLYILICPVSVSWDRACCYCTYLSALCLYHGTEHVVIVHTYLPCVCIMGQSMLLLYILICPVSVSWDRACCYCTYLSALCLYHGTEHVVIVHTYLSCVCIMGESMLLLYILICPVSVSWDRACCYCTYLSALCLYHGTEHVVIVHTYLPCVCIMGQSMLLLYILICVSVSWDRACCYCTYLSALCLYHGTEHVVIVHTYLPCVCIMGQSMLLLYILICPVSVSWDRACCYCTYLSVLCLYHGTEHVVIVHLSVLCLYHGTEHVVIVHTYLSCVCIMGQSMLLLYILICPVSVSWDRACCYCTYLSVLCLYHGTEHVVIVHTYLPCVCIMGQSMLLLYILICLVAVSWDRACCYCTYLSALCLYHGREHVVIELTYLSCVCIMGESMLLLYILICPVSVSWDRACCYCNLPCVCIILICPVSVSWDRACCYCTYLSVLCLYHGREHVVIVHTYLPCVCIMGQSMLLLYILICPVSVSWDRACCYCTYLSVLCLYHGTEHVVIEHTYLSCVCIMGQSMLLLYLLICPVSVSWDRACCYCTYLSVLCLYHGTEHVVIVHTYLSCVCIMGQSMLLLYIYTYLSCVCIIGQSMLLLYILICPVSVSWDRACCYCTYLSFLCLYHGTEHVVIVHIYLSVLCLYHGREHVVIVHTYLSCVCIMGQSMLLLYILICPVSVSWDRALLLLYLLICPVSVSRDRACCYCTYLSVLCLYHGTEHVVIVHTYLSCVCIMGQSMLLLYILICPVSVSWDRACCYCTYLFAWDLCLCHGTEHVVIVHTYLSCVCIMGQSMLLLYILICPVSVSWDRACCYCTYLSVLCLYHGTEHVVIVLTYLPCVCIMGQSMLLLYILICPVSVSWDRACCYCTYLSALCLYHGTEHVVIVHTYLSCVCIMGQSMLLLYILICPVSVSWDRACCYCTYLSALGADCISASVSIVLVQVVLTGPLGICCLIIS